MGGTEEEDLISVTMKTLNDRFKILSNNDDNKRMMCRNLGLNTRQHLPRTFV